MIRRALAFLRHRAARAYRHTVAALPNPASRDQRELLEFLGTRGIPASLDFDGGRFRGHVRGFVDSMRAGDFQYRYAPSVAVPTLYSSVYACLILSLFGQLESLSDDDRRRWAAYFDSFQSPDGLFRDPAVRNDVFERADWWGARHLVLHLIPAYAALGHVPRHRFAWLDAYKTGDASWLGELDPSGDVDNKIMNVVCGLQYERDVRNDGPAGEATQRLQQTLWSRRNADGLWGRVDLHDPASVSRAVQFAYHLYSIFFYDGFAIEPAPRLIDLALQTQNAVGGFAPQLNSSACEDIDSIDLLTRLGQQTDYRRDDVERALRRAVVWILANQNPDGGFVFRRNDPFHYGHAAMTSGRNESAMFPTWFRTLSLAFAQTFLGAAGWQFVRAPGLQFGLKRG